MSQRSSQAAEEEAPVAERPLPNKRAENVLIAIEEVEAAENRKKQPDSEPDDSVAAREKAMDNLWRSMQALAASPTSKPRVHVRVPATPAVFRVVKQIDDAIERKLKPEECGHIRDTMEAVFRG